VSRSLVGRAGFVTFQQHRLVVEGDGGHGAPVRGQRRRGPPSNTPSRFGRAGVGDVPHGVGAVLVEAGRADQDALICGEGQGRHPGGVIRAPAAVFPHGQPEGQAQEKNDGHDESGHGEGAPAQLDGRVPLHPVDRVQMGGQRAAGQVEHGAHAGPVLSIPRASIPVGRCRCPNLVTLAMNGWADGAPVWWLNP
jgi:hypothetical protein